MAITAIRSGRTQSNVRCAVWPIYAWNEGTIGLGRCGLFQLPAMIASEGAWRSIALAATILVLGLAGTAAGGMMTLLYKDINNALVAKQVGEYWNVWLLYSGMGLLVFLAGLAASYLESWIEVDWRRWMTSRLIDEYLGARTYYAITLDGDIDNPDQRIQEEMKPVIDAVTRVPPNLVNSITNIVVQVGILAAIAMPMLIATLVYCALNAVVTYYLNKPTIRQNWNSTLAEADLRFGLLHVRDHAETIAFYRGENGERVHLMQRLARAISAQWTIARYHVAMEVPSKLLTLLWSLLPLLFVAPLYFSGKIEFGAIAAATTLRAHSSPAPSSYSSMRRRARWTSRPSAIFTRRFCHVLSRSFPSDIGRRSSPITAMCLSFVPTAPAE